MNNFIMVQKTTTQPMVIDPQIQKQVEERYRTKLCLTCDNKRHAWGLCTTCHSAAEAKIRRGETTRDELIQAGLMRNKGGRVSESGFADKFEAYKQGQTT